MPEHSPLTTADLTPAAVLRRAAAELDAVWRADAERGIRDGIGDVEYQESSVAPRLRDMADKIDRKAFKLGPETGALRGPVVVVVEAAS